MSYQYIIYENRHLENVARITLNRPEKLNALNAGLLDELFAALAEAEDDDKVKVVIIRGAGRCFCPGYDLNPTPVEPIKGPPPEYDGRGLSWSFFARGRRERTVAEDLRFLYFRANKWLSLWDYRKISIAQVHNYCLSGGNELAGNCDVLVCSDDAVFGHPASRAVGNLPNSYGALWAINMGLKQAKWLAITGKTMNAEEALRVGYVNKVVPKEKLEEETNEAARTVALMDMEYLTIHKRTINRFFEIAGLKASIDSGVEFDGLYHASAAKSAAEFKQLTKEKGLKSALDWRDGKYADGRTVKKAPRSDKQNTRKKD